jgi:AraC family transcriptional regulator of adaptative response/methylated-DNA-[protein]-cysteine methyltransferase
VTNDLLTDDLRWDAVRARDERADGRFVMAVRTTRIYCRPVCPARAPLRKNVAFYADAETAQAAGFRACKRCAPDATSKNEPHKAMVRSAIDAMTNAPAPLSLTELAAHAAMSPFHFHRVFTRLVGITPKAYAKQLRERQARENISAGGSITEAIHDAGYGSASRFYDGASNRLGMTARRLRERGAGETIHFATATTSIGVLLVAATERGVCAIEIGDSEAAVMAVFANRYARANRIAASDGLVEQLNAIVRSIDDPRNELDLPLDIVGTAFQERVWAALRAIPVGSTRTYAEIAASLGAPQSARAVARACAANELALAIPCHRVIRVDGELAGYRWGLERKRQLLAREAEA